MPAKSTKTFSKSYIRENILDAHFERDLEEYLCNAKKDNADSDQVGNIILPLIENIIEVVNTSDFSSSNSKSILNVALCLVHVIEILSPEQIIGLCDNCLSSIRNMAKDRTGSGDENNNCSEQIWKTFIPKIIETMEKKSHFEHCGSRTTGR